MPKVWNAETGEWDFIADTDGPVLEPIEPVKAIAPVKRAEGPGQAKTGKERQAEWRARHPGQHRQYMLDYMRRYRARLSNPPHQDGTGDGLTE